MTILRFLGATAAALLCGLAFWLLCIGALFLGAGYALRGAWRWLNESPPGPRKAFDGHGIPVADWDRFTGEIAAIQREMVRAAEQWRQS